MAEYAPTVDELRDSNNAPLPLNWEGVCHKASTFLACALKIERDSSSYGYFIAAQPTAAPITCPAGQFELRTKANGNVECLGWADALTRIQGI